MLPEGKGGGGGRGNVTQMRRTISLLLYIAGGTLHDQNFTSPGKYFTNCDNTITKFLITVLLHDQQKSFNYVLQF